MAKDGHGDGRRKKSKTGEDGSYHMAQVEEQKKTGFDSNLIWIEIGVLKNKIFLRN